MNRGGKFNRTADAIALELLTGDASVAYVSPTEEGAADMLDAVRSRLERDPYDECGPRVGQVSAHTLDGDRPAHICRRVHTHRGACLCERLDLRGHPCVRRARKTGP